MMDANNNVFNGHPTWKLKAENIEMKEAVHTVVPEQGPNTHREGSVPIDGIWYTPDLTLEKANYSPFDPQLGDHSPVVSQFTQESVLGAKIPRIVPLKVRQLTSKVQRICKKYIEDLGGYVQEIQGS